MHNTKTAGAQKNIARSTKIFKYYCESGKKVTPCRNNSTKDTKPRQVFQA